MLDRVSSLGSRGWNHLGVANLRLEVYDRGMRHIRKLLPLTWTTGMVLVVAISGGIVGAAIAIEPHAPNQPVQMVQRSDATVTTTTVPTETTTTVTTVPGVGSVTMPDPVSAPAPEPVTTTPTAPATSQPIPVFVPPTPPPCTPDQVAVSPKTPSGYAIHGPGWICTVP